MPVNATPPVTPIAAESFKRTKARSWARRGIVLLVAGVLIGVGTEAWRVFLGANFHAVAEGKLYRGAQQTGAQIEELAARLGIRTIVNLRGCCDDADWHLDQTRAVQRLGMCQEDIVLSSGRLPATQELRRLVEVFDQADQPLFLHCFRGADRTGLACAVYLLLKTNASFAEARRQLGWRYGHMPIGRTAWLDHFFDQYQDWLHGQDLQHAPAHFRRWLLEEYRSGGRDYRIEQFTCRAPELRVGRPTGFRVRLRNLGSDAWQFKPGVTSATQLGFNLYDDQDHITHSGKWGLLETRVAPGDAIELNMVIPTVARPGRYRLFVDMLDQENGWFFQTGSQPLEQELVFRE